MDFNSDIKSRDHFFLLSIAPTLCLGSNLNCVIILFGNFIRPERQTNMSDSKRINLVLETEIRFWERRTIAKDCFILNWPLASRLLNEFLDLK